MIEEAGTHASYFKTKYETFPERLAKADYFVGSTGKAWAPGNFKHDGRESNPAGRRYADRSVKGPLKGYAAGFKKFLSERPKDKPFCFWFGSSDAHRTRDVWRGRAVTAIVAVYTIAYLYKSLGNPMLQMTYMQPYNSPKV